MSTIAWLLILIGGVMIRQVSKGRVMNIGEDLSDIFLAIVQGDTKALNEVLARTGDSDTPEYAALGDALGTAVTGAATGVTTTANSISKALGGKLDAVEGQMNSSLAIAAVVLGEKAEGYKWAAIGPKYYDCSGLMYRAAQHVGYKGSRFTTYTIGVNKAFRKVQPPNVEGPGVNGTAGAGINDIVCWPTKHMGVVTGPDRYYSARSRKSGIGESSISGHGGTPVYYRLVK